MAVYGIDFGTCNSCIAVAEDNGNIEVVPSRRNETTTPSLVMFNNEGKPVVGTTAKNAMTRANPNNVVAYIKTELNKDTTMAAYRISPNEQRQMSPIEPTACIYYELVSHSNMFRRGKRLEETDKAVITVPAVCSDMQREQTKIAAQLAGIQVLKVISEPAAAAISYNIKVGETIMVFDLGGGTLDVSIICRISNDEYKVLSTEGHPTLGGLQWDRKLLQLCYMDLGLQYSDDYATPKQLIVMERFKIDLCEEGSAVVNFIDNEGVQQEVEIQLAEFSQFTESLVKQAMQVMDSAIADARTASPNLKIDRVCLAGGSSKMPAIRQAIAAHLPTIPVDISDPDQAIARGAARYALSLIKGGSHYDINVDERGHAYGIVTTDNNGILVVDNIILRTDPIEIEGITFQRFMPNTSNHFRITIIENDVNLRRFRYRKNQHVAYFSGDIEFPKQVPVGECIDFTLSRDGDGIVHLKVACSGKSSRFKFATKMNTISEELRQRVHTLLERMKQ